MLKVERLAFGASFGDEVLEQLMNEMLLEVGCVGDNARYEGLSADIL